ncbi:hypothetical protein Pla175_12140 [Pirellulimonas nuda]|uniref:Transglutaminase-like superfamily protein n=1 Tax=Pirellulimonas nuda TaxID=2528009 RepID=A0A518D8P7_9BACT|nr:hypothetical protein [Pirellulimonas nuda]QDU87847.1 hypothetical protein Pla175_12140 [Pirellulimonas nuda]
MPRLASRSVSLALVVLATLVLGCVAVGGCGGDRQPAKRRAAAVRSALGESGQLLDNIKSSLRSLPEVISLEIAPPEVLLDARKSANGEEIQSIILPLEGSTKSEAKLLVVVSDNAGLQRAGVQAGDLVKFYGKVDEETAQAIGVESVSAIDMLVGQRLDGVKLGDEPHEALILVDGLRRPELTPRRTEIWRTTDDRMREIDAALAKYVRTGEPALAWQPTGDAQALDLVIERLNQWIRPRPKDASWRPAGLLATLPPGLRDDPLLAPYLSDAALASSEFLAYEGRVLQEEIWLRGISGWAHGPSLEPLKRAAALLDWTARNIAITGDLRTYAYRPWDALVFSRGAALHRAWVFCGLCRHLGLEACVIEAPTEDGEPYLLCAVLHDGGLYLFDPVVGLPLPGPDGEPIATWEAVASDDALLRAWDLEGSPYPLSSERLAEATFCVVADPFALTRRAAVLDGSLTGDDRLLLSVDADAVAERLRRAGGVGADQAVALWSAPAEAIRRKLTLSGPARGAAVADILPFTWRPKLWKARVLHFRGALDDDEQKKLSDPLYDPINDHRAAAALYSDPAVRPAESRLRSVAAEKARIYRYAKQQATYLLGLLSFDTGNLTAASNWFDSDALSGDVAARMADGIGFNRALTAAQLGDLDRAIELLEQDESPGRRGALIRAARLREQQQAEAIEKGE